MKDYRTIAAHPNDFDYNKIINFIEWYNKESNKNLSVSQFTLKALNYYCSAIQKEYKEKHAQKIPEEIPEEKLIKDWLI